MLIVMIIAAIFTGGAFLILKQLESKASDAKDLVSIEEQEMMMKDNFESANSEEWSMPVLDGSSNTSQKRARFQVKIWLSSLVGVRT